MDSKKDDNNSESFQLIVTTSWSEKIMLEVEGAFQ